MCHLFASYCTDQTLSRYSRAYNPDTNGENRPSFIRLRHTRPNNTELLEFHCVCSKLRSPFLRNTVRRFSNRAVITSINREGMDLG